MTKFADCSSRLKIMRTVLQPVILILWISLTGCSASKDQIFQMNGPTMGTWYSIKVSQVPATVDMKSLELAVKAELDHIDLLMSTYKPESELSKLNRFEVNTEFGLSAETLEVLNISKSVWKLSDGAFDPTIGPLVNLWGFGPDIKHDAVPDAAEIQRLLQSVGFDSIVLSDSGVLKKSPVSLDLSAVAKGYAVDKLALLLESLGVFHYLVEVGGELRAGLSKTEGKAWVVGVEKPSNGPQTAQAIINITEMAIATSGDYRNYFEQAGKRYSHTLNPKTGYPIEHHLASVSVIHKSCAYADAWATALTVLGPERGLALAEAQGLAVYMLVKEGNGFVSLQTKEFAGFLFKD